LALPQVNEEAESWYKATLKDEDDTLMVPANVSTLTLTIYEKVGEAIVNSKDQTDVWNGGAMDQGLTLHASSGLLTMRLEPDDNQVVNTDNAGRSEIHVLVFEGTTTGSPSYAFKHSSEYEIINFVKTT